MLVGLSFHELLFTCCPESLCFKSTAVNPLFGHVPTPKYIGTAYQFVHAFYHMMRPNVLTARACSMMFTYYSFTYISIFMLVRVAALITAPTPTPLSVADIRLQYLYLLHEIQIQIWIIPSGYIMFAFVIHLVSIWVQTLVNATTWLHIDGWVTVMIIWSHSYNIAIHGYTPVPMYSFTSLHTYMCFPHPFVFVILLCF